MLVSFQWARHLDYHEGHEELRLLSQNSYEQVERRDDGGDEWKSGNFEICRCPSLLGAFDAVGEAEADAEQREDPNGRSGVLKRAEDGLVHR